MRFHQYFIGMILMLCAAVFVVTGPVSGVEAGYSVGFETDAIRITSPTTSGFDTDGVLRVEGETTLDRVWLALRGPNGDTETVPVDAGAGRFGTEIRLRFGAGKYTVWAADNARHFSGEIRFELYNRSAGDVRYRAPSAYVDCDHPRVIALARSLTGELTDDTAKAKAIHGWVTGNISYDYADYVRGDEKEMRKASEVLNAQKGVCRDYALLTAALARAADVPARVVYGQARADTDWDDQYHAWNEFLINGQWVSLDTTWDAGYVKNGSFVRAQSDKYLIPTAGEFKKTHSATKYTTY